MQIKNIMEDVSFMQFLCEMSKREFNIIFNGIKQIARQHGLKAIATPHLIYDRITDSGTRAEIEAADFYQTIEALFNNETHLNNMKKYRENKKHYPVHVQNLNTNLNIAIRFLYEESPDNTTTPFKMVIKTAQLDDNWRNDIRFPDMVHIRVRA